MTPDDLRSLAQEATKENPLRWIVPFDGTVDDAEGESIVMDEMPEHARLIALAPQLALLCADALDYIQRDVVASAALPERDRLLASLEALEKP